MDAIFKGRPVCPGAVEGEAVVSRQGVNTLATFMRTILMRSKKALCADQNNRDLYRRELQGRILCLPKTIGSTSAGLVLMTLASTGAVPSAMLFSENIDSLAAAGVIMADIWVNKRIITVDCLGDDFLRTVNTGMRLSVREDGTVICMGADSTS